MSIRVRRRKGCKGWSVDLHVELPDGRRKRIRKEINVPTKERAIRWAEEKHALLLTESLRPKVLERKVGPKLREFEDDFIARHCEAERQKKSGVEAKRSIFRCYLGFPSWATFAWPTSATRISKLKATMAKETRRRVAQPQDNQQRPEHSVEGAQGADGLGHDRPHAVFDHAVEVSAARG